MLAEEYKCHIIIYDENGRRVWSEWYKMQLPISAIEGYVNWVKTKKPEVNIKKVAVLKVEEVLEVEEHEGYLKVKT